jgi:dTDP-4-amino-4,6-dideoxygalactose transaminase
VLCVKLAYLDEWNAERRRLAALYHERLTDVADLVLPISRAKAFHVYHLFVIQTALRDGLKEFLADNGIDTMVHYPVPSHLQKAYANLKFSIGQFPLTERLSDQVLSLPLWPGLSDDEVHFVADKIKAFFKK